MEDILSKNIFNDRDLYKLSPDYSPSNSIILRMQMRRTLVKDTHSHGVLKNIQMQRKPIKRAKDYYKINKEIVNIRNGFNNINLKNQIMLRNAIKQVDTVKQNDIGICNYIEYETLRNDTDPYLSKIPEDTTDLVVHNDVDFKINDKPEVAKNTQTKNLKIKNNVTKYNQKYTGAGIEDLFRVECKFTKPAEIVEYKQCANREINISDITEPDNIIDAFTNEHVNDLQTLLIMMAISPKSSGKDDDVNNSVVPNEGTIFPSDSMDVNLQNAFIQPSTTQTGDITEILNVIPLRVEINDKQKYILKKYVSKWRDFVSKKNYMSQQRQATLNTFFDKLAKKKMNMNQSQDSANKAKMLTRDFSTYQHRYKVQKHIIALQKAKLEEQNRMIEELRYNKIIEASRQSVDAMREEVRKTYYEIDRQLKPKIKCLTNELKMHEIEEPYLVLHCLKVPQFLQRMEKRAREREEKHALIRERRKQMEEERIRMKQQAELAKTEMDKEEKVKRIKELREKRKREKIDNIRKKQHAERMRALTVMADLHYEKNLIIKYGIRPFKLLLEMNRDNLEKAKAHYKFQLKKNVFLSWMWYTEDMWLERNYMAENFARKKMLRKVYIGLKQNHYDYVLKKQVAEDYYDLYVTQLTFKKFREAIDVLKKEHEIKWQKVVAYHNGNILFKTLTCWRSLPTLNALKREQEVRKARWRDKVLQVVPDYSPPDD